MRKVGNEYRRIAKILLYGTIQPAKALGTLGSYGYAMGKSCTREKATNSMPNPNERVWKLIRRLATPNRYFENVGQWRMRLKGNSIYGVYLAQRLKICAQLFRRCGKNGSQLTKQAHMSYD